MCVIIITIVFKYFKLFTVNHKTMKLLHLPLTSSPLLCSWEYSGVCTLCTDFPLPAQQVSSCVSLMCSVFCSGNHCTWSSPSQSLTEDSETSVSLWVWPERVSVSCD